MKTYITINETDKYHNLTQVNTGDIIRLKKIENTEQLKEEIQTNKKNYNLIKIEAEIPFIGEIGYVEKNPKEIIKGTNTADYIYNKFNKISFAKATFITKKEIICEFIDEKKLSDSSKLSKKIKIAKIMFKKWDMEKNLEKKQNKDFKDKKVKKQENKENDNEKNDEKGNKNKENENKEILNENNKSKKNSSNESNKINKNPDKNEVIKPNLNDEQEIIIEDISEEKSPIISKTLGFSIAPDSDELTVLSEDEMNEIVKNSDFENIEMKENNFGVDFSIVDENGNLIDDDEAKVDFKKIGLQLLSEINKSMKEVKPDDLTDNNEKMGYDEIKIITLKKEELINKYFELKKQIIKINNSIETKINDKEIEFYYKNFLFTKLSIDEDYVVITIYTKKTIDINKLKELKLKTSPKKSNDKNKMKNNNKKDYKENEKYDYYSYNLNIRSDENISNLISFIKENLNQM